MSLPRRPKGEYRSAKHEGTLMTALRKLGPVSRRMLSAAGISSDEELRARGSVAVYLAVKRSGGNASLNLLWALEGALTGRDWRPVAREDRTSLLLQLDDLERSQQHGGKQAGKSGP